MEQKSSSNLSEIMEKTKKVKKTKPKKIYFKAMTQNDERLNSQCNKEKVKKAESPLKKPKLLRNKFSKKRQKTVAFKNNKKWSGYEFKIQN